MMSKPTSHSTTASASEVICNISKTETSAPRTASHAPIGAWLAVRGAEVSPLEMVQMTLLALAVVLWLVGFDIIYALQDYEFDKSHGLRSLVVAWGPQNALAAAFIAHMAMCGLLLGFGLLCRFRIAYVIGWLLILGCLVMEHWIARRRSLCLLYTSPSPRDGLLSRMPSSA